MIALGFNSYQAWKGIAGAPPLREVGPTGLMTLAATYLAFRWPHRVWSKWEAPLVTLAVGLAAVGALTFRVDEDPPQLGFQVFFAGFIGLAFAFGFFCTAVPEDSPFQAAIIQPTKRFSSFGLPGLDIGLVFAPFVFLVLLIGYGLGWNIGQRE